MPERIAREFKRLMKRLSSDNNNSTTEQDIDHHSSGPQDGTVEIHDGVIKVSDPPDGGKFPVIVGKEPLILYINKSKIKLPVRVSSEERLDWRIEESPLFTLEVSEDKMKAYLRVHDTKRYEWKLKSHPPAPYVEVEAEQDYNHIIEALEEAMVIEELEQMGIMGGIDHEAIQAAIMSPGSPPVVVAKGSEPIPGTDADIELYFALEEQTYLTEKDGKVDYRQHHHIPMVRAGELMARKVEKQEGKNGRNIYGHIIPPQPARDVIMAARQHVEIKDHSEVYALKDGRPRMLGDSIKFFDVSTSYIVQGNVDMSTGNIIFIGDVVVYGDVMDGMLIEAMGKVFVFGHVYHATIAATGGIHVQGNVVSSRMYSGLYGVDYSRLYMELKKVSEQAATFIEAVELLNQHLHENNQTVAMGRLLLTLLDQKFSHLPQLFHDLVVLTESIKSSAEHDFSHIRSKVEPYLKPQRMQEIRSIDELYAMQANLADMRQKIRSYEEKKAGIEVRQCHHSLLKATGDIRIKKEGIIQSDLYTEGNIIFYDRHSVCRGGSIIAEGSISAMKVGGEGSGRTQLTAGYRILAESIMESRICIRRQCRDIAEPVYYCKAYLKDKVLVIESGEEGEYDE
ncbi:DUF342 domain-containing protein [Ammoniphilus sp. CFH 90114]|uniref:DUF342 domain-containing protein n=1 Tax=Ammoniphilus sp. CFH 90114 TaxID=2493665 RepID=UPI00100F659F|nr:FapA family protein [Ammoniphilus sp. CFH 90114]RXT06265.1 DUF342 domain-containing protein [Ammoniphilus sp. CFH 90114]